MEAAGALVRRAYRVLLNRNPEPDVLESLSRRLHEGHVGPSAVYGEIAASAEFAVRLDRMVSRERNDETSAPPSDPTLDRDDAIDVSDFLASTTSEQLIATAEHYFQTVVDEETLLSKPFKDLSETPEVLTNFGQALRGLELSPGARVLDFGAGACWTSHALTQLGCAVTAVDVSFSALEMGKRLFERRPPFGDTTPPTFSLFDGTTLDIADSSIDRVLCFDAFHHVGNPDRVIEEFARVLRPGGMAVFAEPGPNHSLSGPSQFAMRHWGVLENDVKLEVIWPTAHACGFDRLDVCLHDPYPEWVDPRTFDATLRGDVDSTVQADPSRRSMSDRRLFRLVKPGEQILDSRVATGLAGDITTSTVSVHRVGTRIHVEASVLLENTGTRTWLASGTDVGVVVLGLRSHVDGETLDLFSTPIGDDDIAPGESTAVDVSTEIDDPDRRFRTLDFDLHSQGVTWFSRNGSRPISAAVDD